MTRPSLRIGTFRPWPNRITVVVESSAAMLLTSAIAWMAGTLVYPPLGVVLAAAALLAWVHACLRVALEVDDTELRVRNRWRTHVVARSSIRGLEVRRLGSERFGLGGLSFRCISIVRDTVGGSEEVKVDVTAAYRRRHRDAALEMLGVGNDDHRFDSYLHG